MLLFVTSVVNLFSGRLIHNTHETWSTKLIVFLRPYSVCIYNFVNVLMYNYMAVLDILNRA